MKASLTQGARIEQVLPGTWRLSIPEGHQGTCRLAQLDNYRGETALFSKQGNIP
jgi:hypothetical protein